MKLNPVIQKKIVSELRKGVSLRQVAKKVRVSPTTVTVISNKLKEINISLEELLLLSNQEFVDKLGTSIARNIEKCKPIPDFNYIFDQLKIRDMTLKQLWLEFKEQVVHCVSYSRFE